MERLLIYIYSLDYDDGCRIGEADVLPEFNIAQNSAEQSAVKIARGYNNIGERSIGQLHDDVGQASQDTGGQGEAELCSHNVSYASVNDTVQTRNEQIHRNSWSTFTCIRLRINTKFHVSNILPRASLSGLFR